MRAAELIGRPVQDDAGKAMGRVLDIRLRQIDDAHWPEESADVGAWEIDGVVVGHRLAYPRAGYAYGGVRRPAVLRVLLQALGRHLRYVPWDSLRLRHQLLTCAGPRGSFSHPGELT